MKLNIEVKESMSITDIYNAVAKAMNINPEDVTGYDCREIYVSSEIADAVEEYYKENCRADWKMAFGMDWLCYGAKATDELSGSEVEITAEFMKFEEGNISDYLLEKIGANISKINKLFRENEKMFSYVKCFREEGDETE